MKIDVTFDGVRTKVEVDGKIVAWFNQMDDRSCVVSLLDALKQTYTIWNIYR